MYRLKNFLKSIVRLSLLWTFVIHGAAIAAPTIEDEGGSILIRNDSASELRIDSIDSAPSIVRFEECQCLSSSNCTLAGSYILDARLRKGKPQNRIAALRCPYNLSLIHI